MQKTLKYKKILYFTLASLSLLGLMLVGTKITQAIVVANGGFCDGAQGRGLCVAPVNSQCPTGFKNPPSSISTETTMSSCDKNPYLACCAVTTECVAPNYCATSADTCQTGDSLVPGAICLVTGSEGRACCKVGALSDICNGTIGTTEVKGTCQEQACADPASIITSTECTDAKKVNCCKAKPAGAPTFDKCSAAGGTCAETCTAPNSQDVTSQVNSVTTECTTTPNTRCCKAPDAAAPVENTTPTGDSALGQPPQDEEAGYIAKAFAWMISLVIWLFGSLLLACFELIVKVAQFNQIVNSYFVVQGWIVLRDLVNMFFVLGLLFIAFVTVLKIEKYQWQKLLPKLLIMAVVVNFSRTICGLIIDFFQVMMFTFVNAFKDIAAENLFKGLGLRDMWDVTSGKQTPGTEMGGMALIIGRVLGLIYVIVALIVCVIFLVILVFRIIMLWILVVFSPLAFFSAAFSGIASKAGNYWSKWFSMFIEYCMVGPLLAFFLWLSILSLGSDYTTMYAQQMSPASSQGQDSLSGGVTNNKAGRLDYIMKFVLGIVMLVAGLKFTSETKVIGASMAGKAATGVQGFGLKVGSRLAGGAYKYTGMGIKEGLGRWERSGKFGSDAAKAIRFVGTKEGRQTMAERTQARIESFAGGKRGALEVQRQKEQDRYKKEYELMGADKDPKVLEKAMKTASFDRLWALNDIKGEQGKTEQKDMDRLIESGAVGHYGVKTKIDPETGKKVIDVENSKDGALASLEARTKKWEDKFEEKNGYRISISPIIRNPETNEWTVVAGGTTGEVQKAKDVMKSAASAGTDKVQKMMNNKQAGNIAEGSLLQKVSLWMGSGKNIGRMKQGGEQGLKNSQKATGDLIKILTGSDDDRLKMAQEFAKDNNVPEGKEKETFIAEKLAEMNLHHGAATMKTEDRKKYFEDVATKNKLEGSAKDSFVNNSMKKSDVLRKDIYTKDNLKSLQDAYTTSGGSYVQGTGQLITPGTSNDNLATLIANKQLEAMPAYNDLKKTEPELIKEADRIIPGALKSLERLPETEKIEGVKKQLERVMGDSAKQIPDDVIKEYVNVENSQDIIRQEESRDSYGKELTKPFSEFANKVGRSGGITETEANILISRLEGLLSGMSHSTKSAGMSQEFFGFDKLRESITAMENIAQKPVKKQQELMSNILKDVQGEGYYNQKLPQYKENKEKKPKEQVSSEEDRRNTERERRESEAEARRRHYEEGGFDFDSGDEGAPPVTPPPASTTPPAASSAPAPVTPEPSAPAAPASSAPAAPEPSTPAAPQTAATVNVTNVSNSFIKAGETVLSQSNNNDQMIQNLKRLQTTFSEGLDRVQGSLGNKFDTALGASIKKQMAGLLTEVQSSPDIKASRVMVDRAINNISKQINDLEKKKA